MRTQNRLLGAGLVALSAAMASVAVLGPLVLDVLRYRVSLASLNQIIGGDAAALTVVVPITAAVGVLLLLAVFILAGAVALWAWITTPAWHDPDASTATAIGSVRLTALNPWATRNVLPPERPYPA